MDLNNDKEYIYKGNKKSSTSIVIPNRFTRIGDEAFIIVVI